jgi:hypothetical protein
VPPPAVYLLFTLLRLTKPAAGVVAAGRCIYTGEIKFFLSEPFVSGVRCYASASMATALRFSAAPSAASACSPSPAAARLCPPAPPSMPASSLGVARVCVSAYPPPHSSEHLGHLPRLLHRIPRPADEPAQLADDLGRRAAVVEERGRVAPVLRLACALWCTARPEP